MELSNLAIIISFLSGALATQENAPRADPAPPSVKICKDAGFGGQCTIVQAPLNACVDVPSGWNDVTSSLRSTIEAGNCRFYRDYKCNGPTFDSEYPGFDDLATQLPSFDNQVSSFRCFGRVPV